ncbi:MAG: hypothetical protein FGM33_05130 [Candidatus Kapabacteria bacterium]|nr:hypothetical protein [Candidatus Kapabacteria bacterium]
MRRTIAMTALTIALSGCELFVIGTSTRRPTVIERSQRSSAGVVHVFKAEIDSGNTTAATELMVSGSGRPLLAVEKYELADDLVRWRSVMAGIPISETRIDTVSESVHDVTITLDYIRKMQFGTLRKDGQWWITKITDLRRK